MVTAFISYSRDSDEHNDWVLDLATRLRADGIASTLDQWSLAPGDSLTRFMETLVAHDFAVIICTPEYKHKFDERKGGVGFEAELIASQQFVFGNRRKFVPVLRGHAWEDSAPVLFLGLFHVDLRGDRNAWLEKYRHLLDTLHGRIIEPPPVKSQGLRALTDGTVLDEGTKLVWANVDDEQIVEWSEFLQKLDKLSMQTGWSWRIPTQEEIDALKQIEKHYVVKPVKVAVEKYHPWFGKYEKEPRTPARRRNVASSGSGSFRPMGFNLPGLDPYHAAAEVESLRVRFLARFVREYRTGEETG